MIIDVSDVERLPTLNNREMLRILDARSQDIGKGKIITDDCTPERYAALLNQFSFETPGLKLKKYDIADCGAI